MSRDHDRIQGRRTTFNSASIYTLALQAAQRCTGHEPDIDAWAAVILAYAALEAFLNEDTQLSQTLLRKQEEEAKKTPPPHKSEPILEKLAKDLSEAQEKRKPTDKRYDLAWEIMTGKEIERDKDRRKDLETLHALRNGLVYLKSGEVEFRRRSFSRTDDLGRDGIHIEITMHHTHYEDPEFQEILQYLEGKGLLTELEVDERHHWVDLICTRPLANWACETVAQLADDLVSVAPQSLEFRDDLKSYSLGGCRQRLSQNNRA